MTTKHKKSAAGLQPKVKHSDRIDTLANRIKLCHWLCVNGNKEIMKKLKSIEEDVEIIAREIARQVRQKQKISSSK
jgi:hypothetical protein